jgi:dTDP-4-amino-4,6-dideoxygalactose transaminase
MYARKRLDIGWLDLAHGLTGSLTRGEEAFSKRRVESWFAANPTSGPTNEVGAKSAAPARGALCCLSVRTGFDLYLQTLALPRGSEVLMSALTIPDMWRIVEHHGLVPIPVDLDPRTLAPRIDLVRGAATSKTRALVIAHLFGACVPLEPYLALARERGWVLLEDCAQSFTGADSKGHPQADVSMFSFGPIKTAAALAGGVVCVKDPRILAEMRAREAAYPLQSRAQYAQRILKYSGLKAITNPILYRAFVGLCGLAGKDHDRVIQGSVRGFAGGDFFAKLRRRPSAALCALVARRLAANNSERVARRAERARALVARLGSVVELPAGEAMQHSYWVFTILADDPARLVADLRAAGFDATRAASLAVVPAPADRASLDARDARQLLARMVYLPVYPELPARAIEPMADAVRTSVRGLPAAAADPAPLARGRATT